MKQFFLILSLIYILIGTAHADIIRDSGPGTRWIEVDGSPSTRPRTVVVPNGTILSVDGSVMSLDIVTGVSADASYLRLDASNDPITGNLDAIGITKLGDSTTNYSNFATNGRLTFVGTAGIELPHASLSDSTTQTNAVATTAYPITFDTQEDMHGITHSTSVNPSRVYINTDGVYLIIYSTVVNVSTNDDYINIWLAIDGTNVARTNTIQKIKNANTEALITVSFTYHFTAGCYFELRWCASTAGASLLATAAAANPTRPTCPSTIMTVNMISKD